ncbi:hypothetical protein EDD15DRAFT_2372222 [Pisolithus albus]|nr:hypothetical protein EDD15DRAFT_2372222 [Pisolithus albus]
MDSADFAKSFDVEDSDLLDLIDQGLLEGDDEERGSKLEMYKLNVYCWRTRISREITFGSLVIFLPASHEGGGFILCNTEHEWEVDLAKSILESSQQPCVSYVAFFSDVEHENPCTLSRCPPNHLHASTIRAGKLAEGLYEIVPNGAVPPVGGNILAFAGIMPKRVQRSQASAIF